jgi:hypothetical protein
MSKRVALLFIVILAVSSLIVVKAAPALASIPKPCVPEFTLKYVDNSYDVPSTYGIDQYTGENVTTEEGYHVDDRMIEFTIKNQPFNSYSDTSGNDIDLYYNFRFKGHYGDEWSYYPFKPDGYSTLAYGMFTDQIKVGLSPKYPASSSAYTVVSVNVSILDGLRDAPDGTQAEFQAQAIVGHIDYEPSGLLAGSYYKFIGETSDWSDTQTITIGENVPTVTPKASPSQNPTATARSSDTQSGVLFGLIWEQTALAVLCVLVVVLVVAGLLVYFKKRSRQEGRHG